MAPYICSNAANRSRRDPALKIPLGIAYINADMFANAVLVLTEAQRAHEMLPDDLFGALGDMRAELREQAEKFQQPVKRVTEGLSALEQCKYCMIMDRLPAAIKAGRTAVRILPKSTLAHNSLALAYLQGGQPKQAWETTQKSLVIDPNDPGALVNAIHFSVWGGRHTEAEQYWLRLQALPDPEQILLLQKMRAATLMEDDEAVHALMQSDFNEETLDEDMWLYSQLHLAVAEANLGFREQALSRLKGLPLDEGGYHWKVVAALEANRNSLGYAQRFSFNESSELLPGPAFEELEQLMISMKGPPSRKERNQIDRLVERHPQLLLLGEKLIWDEGEPESGLELLGWMATPEAHTALRRFGLGQAGPPQTRMRALLALAASDGAQEDELFRFWLNDEWIDVDLRTQTVVLPEPDPYSDEVADLIREGLIAQRIGDTDTAIVAFRRALELEPNARDACNNLGYIYVQQGNAEEGIKMFARALEIDPNYPMARLNLAALQIEADELEAARTTLDPLAQLDALDAQDAANYQCLLADIAIQEDRLDDAQDHLDRAQKADPDSEVVAHMKQQLSRQAKLDKVFSGLRRFWRR